MYFAKQHPELVSKVITLDNLRVPFVLSDKLKILSFRSKDPNFKTDPGVLPTPQQARQDGIDIVKTNAQHTDMSDRGPELCEGEDSGDAGSFSERQCEQRAVGGGYRKADRFKSRSNRSSVGVAGLRLPVLASAGAAAVTGWRSAPARDGRIPAPDICDAIRNAATTAGRLISLRN